MRHDECTFAPAPDRHVVEGDEVEIEGARTPVHHTHPTGLGLDPVEQSQQRIRVERRADFDDHVEIRTLVVRTADRIGFVHLRGAHHETTEARERESQIRLAVAEIAPERDECTVLPTGDRPWEGVLPPEANCGRVDVLVDRWLEFGQREFDRLHQREGQHGLGHLFGETFEKQVTGRAREIGQRDGHLSVVNRLPEIVGAARLGQVDLDIDVDTQRLWGESFVVEDTDQCVDPQVVDQDVIGHEASRYRFDMTKYDPSRVIASLRELAERTGGPEGSRRLCWTPEWVAARNLLRESLATLPVDVDVDEAGNLWAYLRGQSPDTLVVGSHLDSVPKGGWLDGALGVMAGLELLRSLADEYADSRPPVTVALVDWADEEGARFGRSLFGSAAVMGTVDVDIARGLVDKEGNRLVDVLPQHGVDIDRLDGARTRLGNVKAYVEVHIEQGPVLESLGRGISTVTGTKGIERERLVFRGQAAHAGTMPMPMRRDSFRAASRFALAVAEIGERHDGVTTVGAVACRPGVVTAVAGETTITLDMRHIDAGSLAAMLAESRTAADAAADAEGCTVEWEHIFRIPPMPFHPELLDAARTSVREVEGHDVEIPSGALHDASEMARSVPTVMIFSSSTAGLSHTKEEDTPVEHLNMAADAFDRTCRRAMELVASGRL